MIKLSNILNEIGEGTSKPFQWKPSENIQNWLDQANKLIEKYTAPGGMTRVIDLGEFKYYFTSDITKTEYFVVIEGWGGRTRKPIRFGTAKKAPDAPVTTKFFMECVVSFGIKDTSGEDNTDKDTNLNEQYRVMATVAECIFNFIKSVEDHGDIQISEMNMYPKADKEAERNDSSSPSVASRRGRMYLAYIKKMISKLPSKRKFHVITTGQNYGFSIVAGEARPGSALASN